MKERSPITTHILDISRGRAAGDVPVRLDRLEAGIWTGLARGVTNADGRIETLLKPGAPVEVGTYRLTFETSAYFKSQGLVSFYPEVVVTFELNNPKEHYHVPLLVSPFGYSTYRGT